MNQQKMTAPVLEHRDGREARGTITKTRIHIVPNLKKFVHNFVVGLGAAGVGLIVGCGLPQLLGLADFQPWPLLIGYVLTALGCLEEVRGHEGHSD